MRTAVSATSSPARGGREDRVDGAVRCVHVVAGQAQQRVVADERLETAVLAAVALRPGRVHDVVPDLAGVAVVPAQRRAVDDDPGADADAADQVDDVVAVAPAAALVLGEHGEVGVVADDHRHADVVEQRSELGVAPAEVRGEADRPRSAVDRARHADADRGGRVVQDLRCAGRRAVRGAARPPRRGSGRRPPAATAGRRRAGRRGARAVVPPIPTAATVRCATSTSTASTNGPPPCGPTTCDGRPARSPPLGTDSSTKPSAVRSATSAPIVDRLSPSRAVSSARVSGPSRWIWARMTARLCRRMSSGRAAGRSGRMASRPVKPARTHPPDAGTARRRWRPERARARRR